MERYLEITQYKNLGVNETQRLVLNRGAGTDILGGLVTVIGGNNAGKSNLLETLRVFSSKSINSNAITTLSFEECKRQPKLKMKTIDGKNISSVEIGLNGITEDYLSLDSSKNEKLFSKMRDESIVELKNIKEKFINHPFSSISELASTLYDNFSNNDVDYFITSNDSSLKSLYDKFDAVARRGYSSQMNRLCSECNLKHLSYESLREKFHDEESSKNNSYFMKYGIKRTPIIYNYENRVITSSQFSSDINRITSNQFIMSLFKAIDFNQTTIENVYKTYAQTKAIGVFTKFETEANKKLNVISNKFNKLYNVDDEYQFSIRMESTQICVSLTRCFEPLNIDMQSTGFKWFFNLFFSLYIFNDLKAGDIILMDEPATNLHVTGQQELRSFLKEFAIMNGLTFVIATHSPFLLDVDHLDELRVVSQVDGHAHIDNDFATINYDDPDSLASIKSALTVKANILIDYDTKVVFVEGITDYNYLVAMKHRLNIENLVFLPIRGLGDGSLSNASEIQEEISKKLISIVKHNPILLVDSDKAGKSMKKVNKDSKLTVFSLDDISSEFNEIESLFCSEDKADISLDKSSAKSSVLKQNIIFNNLKLNDLTVSNFKKLFNYIDELN
ncbi:MAG: AAA family ATPase [bacterium]